MVMKVYHTALAAIFFSCSTNVVGPDPSVTPASDSGAESAGADASSADPDGSTSGGDAGDGDASSSVVIAAAGDISDDSVGYQQKTSDLIFGNGYDAVLLLGDNQYEKGSLSDYNKYYEPTWGRFKTITYPAAGNHEYSTSNASGYFSYFGTRAGEANKGYYSFDLGSWHVIALNTNDNNCGYVGCGASSSQVAWLKEDLQKNTQKCTLAFWHHPRFNSGASHGNFSGAQAFWDVLYAAGADVVLNGHEHIYERFDPQDPSAAPDAQKGIRQFTVGTGGRGFYGLGTTKANSAVRRNDTYGVLKMTLRADAYDWEFVPIAGSTFADKGAGQCH